MVGKEVVARSVPARRALRKNGWPSLREFYHARFMQWLVPEPEWLIALPPDVAVHVRKLAALPGFPRQLARFSAALKRMNEKHTGSAKVLAEQAWRMDAQDPVVRQLADWAIRKRVPGWHFGIINDDDRNAIYQAALNRRVRPGMIVFEVGTGTGILAMLAARAGAAHVYTCEMEPLLVEVARENIARNGLADRVTVIPKRSNDVQLGMDLPERADLFVAEIVDNGLLGEEALAITADVQARLLKPGAVLLPDQIELRGTLVGGPQASLAFRARPACGLDVSALDRLGPATVQSPAGLETDLAEDVVVLRFDLAVAASYRRAQTSFGVTVRTDGAVEGFLHWIWLRFGEGLEYTNRPPAVSCWGPRIHAFTSAMPVTAGQVVTMQVQHDCKRVRIWSEA